MLLYSFSYIECSFFLDVCVCVCVCARAHVYTCVRSQTWMWVSGPLCLYCAERFYRYIRSSDPVTIVTVIRHPSEVVEVRMLKRDFKAHPGQVVTVRAPWPMGLDLLTPKAVPQCLVLSCVACYPS